MDEDVGTVRNMEPSGRVMAGRFRLGRVLGQGGMGTVHEALDLTLERPVAIKVLLRGLEADEHQIQRFEREARAAARLSHPNVVGVTELVRDEENGLGLVMELLSGMSLGARLQGGPLPESEAVSVFMQALDGLAAAHAAGMVHRDLKPSNLFLVPIAGGVLVKILDFGIVKLAEEGAAPKLTRKGALLGTPAYMSPEQVRSEPVDARSDVYSLGACLYEALVARPPYEGPHSLALIAAVAGGPPEDVRTIDGHVSPDLAHVVRTAMSRDPAGRYQTADAMREALRGVLPSVRTPTQTRLRAMPSLRDEAPTEVRDGIETAGLAPLPTSRPWLVPSAIVAVLFLGAVGLWAGRTPAPAPVAPATPAPVAPLPAATAPLETPEVVIPSPRPTRVVAPSPPPVVAPPPAVEPEIPRGIDPPPEVEPEPEPRPRRTTPRTPRETTPDEGHGGAIGESIMNPFAH